MLGSSFVCRMFTEDRKDELERDGTKTEPVISWLSSIKLTSELCVSVTNNQRGQKVRAAGFM